MDLLLLLVLLLGLAVPVMWVRRVGRWRHRQPRSGWSGIDTAPWPALTVFVVARAQDASLSACLQALVSTAYPEKALRIVPVCGAGDAQSRSIVKAYAHLFPDRILPCPPTAANSGPGAAWRDALALANGDLVVVLDPRQLPGPGLLKQLAKPFFDPEVGAVLGGGQAPGRTVPPAAVDGLAAPATLAAWRLSAVQAVGGWVGEGLVEVDALSQRLRAAGWSCVVNPRAVWLPAPGVHQATPQPATNLVWKPATTPATRPAKNGPAAAGALADPLHTTPTRHARATPRLMEQT